jgi:hypothetical protein
MLNNQQILCFTKVVPQKPGKHPVQPYHISQLLAADQPRAIPYNRHIRSSRIQDLILFYFISCWYYFNKSYTGFYNNCAAIRDLVEGFYEQCFNRYIQVPVSITVSSLATILVQDLMMAQSRGRNMSSYEKNQ